MKYKLQRLTRWIVDQVHTVVRVVRRTAPKAILLPGKAAQQVTKIATFVKSEAFHQQVDSLEQTVSRTMVSFTALVASVVELTRVVRTARLVL